ncbi:phosphogluconate dehydratase [Cupriavidus gilardii]|uniref:Phosphogluconate dehydratase n=1 Tax=Cupriavidus gilardii TaxID=82541 RepID=A0A6N1BAR2_9BURK|nr:phosphogluconate dehydratase [Cupriavidus gilardii]ALD93731.1 phosphogluconate dehydratase [Cupriavidus gilardii CR3]QQE09023.1 phosphogluconate dehydratase [Cupriavidus sp. ISTL7]KAB0596973.1 phosphogluconate dehydratase [Cupriavidus gilardii]MCT9014960.1 phosphogluconate dehydratase [Cupriavidus gilardii]MCT9053372.1 phosphogluconate dehydratase [Cupriavidus gilardii]
MPHPVLEQVTARIVARSAPTRQAYLSRTQAMAGSKVQRAQLSCTNLAHGFASMPEPAKIRLKAEERPNVAIVSSYNDMLSAHQPLGEFPAWLKETALEAGATAQFAGGVPAMCDGVTQGQDGMELSLFSRDVIAQATAVALSHQMFDAALYLGICDKIVPGLVMGALSFGHLPAVFVPGGPMPTGIPNEEKARIRQLYAQGKIGREELLEAESRSYHSPGTCTFYGTANSNQMLMEIMGLHLPGTAFINPYTPLREALTREAARHVLRLVHQGERYTPIAQVLDERAFVNGIVGLLATGGSTNHTLHLIAMARVAGIVLTWDDFDELSAVVPLLARVYPNGQADVNGFQAAGGLALVIRGLLARELLHNDVTTIVGQGLEDYTREPALRDGKLVWLDGPTESLDTSVVRGAGEPFAPDGGIKVLDGNLGRAVIKTSAVKAEHQVVQAPARVFHHQDDMLAAFKRGELERDFVAVLPFQGPAACGMPELHKLTPTLTVLQDRGFHVALVTDGRMSGASGKVPAAIHVCPEALKGGAIGKVRDGDMIRVDAPAGILTALVPQAEWEARTIERPDLSRHRHGVGRDLFGNFRRNVSTAEQGACTLFADED